MPCDQVRTTYLAMEKLDAGLVLEAMSEMGFQSTSIDETRLAFHARTGRLGWAGTFTKGQGMTFVDGVVNLDTFRQTYAKAAVKQATTKFGWSVKAETGNKFRLERRAF